MVIINLTVPHAMSELFWRKGHDQNIDTDHVQMAHEVAKSKVTEITFAEVGQRLVFLHPFRQNLKRNG